jgi:hypothetical protein
MEIPVIRKKGYIQAGDKYLQVEDAYVQFEYIDLQCKDKV